MKQKRKQQEFKYQITTKGLAVKTIFSFKFMEPSWQDDKGLNPSFGSYSIARDLYLDGVLCCPTILLCYKRREFAEAVDNGRDFFDCVINFFFGVVSA